MVQRQITRAIAQCWTPAGDDVLVSYGYALPYAAALWPDGHWHFDARPARCDNCPIRGATHDRAGAGDHWPLRMRRSIVC